MPKVVVKGESVYQCSICSRSVRVPTNKHGMDVLSRCNITYGCQGKLKRVTLAKQINETPAFPPEVQGVQDWFQRRVLYTHDQPVQSPVWLINHNLSNRPKVHAFVYRLVDGISKLVPTEPKYERTIDANTIEIEFDTAEAGTAQCISLASQNSINPNATASVVADTSAFQVSSDAGEITLATLSDAELVGIALTYRTSGTSIDVTIEYAGIDSIPTVNSPWSGAEHAIINGKRYTLRSFNITTTPLAPAYFAAGAVPQGSMFYVSNYNGSAPALGDCLILLGRSPYATVDRLVDRYIDVSAINTQTPEMYYSQGKAFVSPTVIKSTYPHILVV